MQSFVLLSFDQVLEQRRTDSGPTACHATTVKRRQTANQNTAVAGKERAKEPRVGHAVHRNAGNVKEFDVVDGLRANPVSLLGSTTSSGWLPRDEKELGE